MEYCDLKRDLKTGESKGFAYVHYNSPAGALMVTINCYYKIITTFKALQQLDGFEIVTGYCLKVMFAEPKNKGENSNNNNNGIYMNNGMNGVYQGNTAYGVFPPSSPDYYGAIPSSPIHAFSPPWSPYSPDHSPVIIPISPEQETGSIVDVTTLYITILGNPLPEYNLYEILAQFPGLFYLKLSRY